MPVFKKKDVFIRAVEFSGDLESAFAIMRWVNAGLPPDANSKVTGILLMDSPRSEVGPTEVYMLSFVSSTRGQSYAMPGSWIIKHDNGDHESMGNTEFQATYDLVEDDE